MSSIGPNSTALFFVGIFIAIVYLDMSGGGLKDAAKGGVGGTDYPICSVELMDNMFILHP